MGNNFKLRPLPRAIFFLALLFPSLSAPISHFESWMKIHQKVYPTTEEKLRRYTIYEDNLRFINAHNSQPGISYTLSANAFADLTDDEFRATRLGLRFHHSRDRNGTVFAGRGASDLPESLDWRAQGAVTSIKDQDGCGDCWAFSATGAIEGINKIFTGSLVSLSDQELCDCDYLDKGCGGGLMDSAFKWVIDNGGIHSEAEYPHRDQQGSCIKDKLSRLVITIDGFTDIPPGDENLLLQAVAKQPVSAGICARGRDFKFYQHGIFDGPCSVRLDHAVLIVGYGSRDGLDYWILKNSWGTPWGMSGYMLLRRNSGNSEGVCGINLLASFPTKTHPNPPVQPEEFICNFIASCPVGSTCCCQWKLWGWFCIQWACCQEEYAVCCKDGKRCCPWSNPICSDQEQECLKARSQKLLGSEKVKAIWGYAEF